jgi:hypothetical protein
MANSFRDHIMNKKILLGAAIAVASMQASAVPFAPTDARAMAMGGTGVAAAKTVHATQFNPSLLSAGDDSDDFGLLLPQVGGYVSDEDDFIDSADAFSEADHVTAFEGAVQGIEAPLNAISGLLPQIQSNSGDVNDLATLKGLTGQLTTQTGLLNNGTTALSLANQNLTGTTSNGTVIEGNTGLASLSQKALRGGLGGGLGIAIPSKKFSVAISASNSTTFSGVLNVSNVDLQKLTAYTDATDAYAGYLDAYAGASDDVVTTLEAIETAQNAGDTAEVTRLTTSSDADALPTRQTALTTAETNLNGFSYGFQGEGGTDIFQSGVLVNGANTITLESTVDIIAVAISEVGLSISREFNIANQDVAIGITPKLQRIDAYDYVVNVEDETDTGNISDFGVDDTGFNLDIGASTKFGAEGQGQLGLVIKNIMSKDVDTVNGNTVSIAPQVRAGVAYNLADWVHLAADLDITENEPVAFESPTQFAALGAELDVFGFMQVRAGYRTNLAEGGQDVISAGFGLSPFGLFHIDLGAYTNTSKPEKEAGAVFELGVDW